MKKPLTIILIIGCVLLLAFIGWFWLLPGSSAPVADKIKGSLPFGTGEGVNIPVDSNQQTVNSGEEREGQTIPNLFQISKDPVAGFVAFNKTGTTTTIRYADRATGHIYDVDPVTFEKTKVTNKTLPKIYEAYFKSDGSSVLYRSLGEGSEIIDNLSLALTAPKSTSTALYTMSATALRGDVDEVMVGSGNTLYYSIKDSKQIVSSNFDGSSLKTILNSPFTNWRITPYGKSLLIYTKASYSTPGYAYTIKSSSSLSKVLGPLNGLVATANTSGTRVAYSYVEGGSTKTVALNTADDTTYPLVSTIAEKCIWSDKNKGTVLCGVPSKTIGAEEPDNWYAGITHFSDRIWSTNVDSEISEILAQPEKDFNTPIDVYRPALSPNEDYLLFINKINLSLWALKLK